MGKRLDERLFEAIKEKKELDTIKVLLSAGADILARNEHHTVLHSAVSGNNQEVINLVLNKIKENLRDEREIQTVINAKDTEGDTPLMWAAILGDSKTIQILLDYNADIEVRNDNGMTALHWAVEKDKKEVVRLLLNKIKETDRDVSQYINAEDDNGMTALHLAVKKDKMEVVRLLLNKIKETDRDVSQYINAMDTIIIEPSIEYDAGGNTLLMWALANRSENSAQILLDYSADIEVRNNHGWTALHWAARENNKEVVRLLLNKIKETRRDVSQYINAKDIEGVTPLMWAAVFNSANVAQILLDYGADIGATDIKGRTALYFAAGDKGEVLSLLLETQRDMSQYVNAKDTEGGTPLMQAAKYGHSNATQILLDYGADTETRNIDGMTALHWAARGNNKEVVRLLLNKIKEIRRDVSQYINAKDTNGNTPLIWAANDGSANAVQILLEYGADTEAKTNTGRTALYWAAKENKKEVVSLLLNKIKETQGDMSQYVNAKDTEGNTPLMWASKFGHENVAEILINYGADTEIRNNDGMTALHWAAKENKWFVAKALVAKGADVYAEDKNGKKPLDIARDLWDDGPCSVTRFLYEEDYSLKEVAKYTGNVAGKLGIGLGIVAGIIIAAPVVQALELVKDVGELVVKGVRAVANNPGPSEYERELGGALRRAAGGAQPGSLHYYRLTENVERDFNRQWRARH